MKTRADVRAAMLELRKAIEKVARCIDQAARDSDPSKNAELMKSLHRAQDSRSAARRALNTVSGTALSFGEQLAALLPDEEQQSQAKVA